MATMRERVTELLRNHPDADYWEKLVLRYAEALLAQVDENLRGVPMEEAGLELLDVEDYFNLPDSPVELVDGLPVPKRWRLVQEGRRRLGWATAGEEREQLMGLSYEEIIAEIDRRRVELRARPFVPSQIPFPSGPPED